MNDPLLLHCRGIKDLKFKKIVWEWLKITFSLILLNKIYFLNIFGNFYKIFFYI